MELDPKALEARVREAMLHLSVGPPSKESRMRKVLLRLDSMKLPDAVRENIFPLEGWIFSCLKSSGDQSRENVHATTEVCFLPSSAASVSSQNRTLDSVMSSATSPVKAVTSRVLGR